MRSVLVSVLLLLSGAALAQTPSTSRDYSNLWFIENESGWGMNVIQQERILFITLFIYGPDRRPTWLVGPAVTYSSTDSNGNEIYTGDLYATTGTPFNTTPFDASSVTVTRVGSITFTGRSNGNASVSYTVESGSTGTGTVTKNVVRQTWSGTNVGATTYFGGVNLVNSNCAAASDNGLANVRADLTLTISGTSLTLLFTTLKPGGGVDQQCRLLGNYTQSGRSGSSTGKIQCPVGTDVGTYTLTGIGVSSSGFHARMSGTADCTVNGNIGGVKLVQ
jgi:hypothetical protein